MIYQKKKKEKEKEKKKKKKKKSKKYTTKLKDLANIYVPR